MTKLKIFGLVFLSFLFFRVTAIATGIVLALFTLVAVFVPPPPKSIDKNEFISKIDLNQCKIVDVIRYKDKTIKVQC